MNVGEGFFACGELLTGGAVGKIGDWRLEIGWQDWRLKRVGSRVRVEA